MSVEITLNPLRLTTILLLVISIEAYPQIRNKNISRFETGQFYSEEREELAEITRVIDENEIRLRGANNLKDILIMETGGIFTYHPVKGWQFQWHGSQTGNILILIDGLPFRSEQFDEQDLQQIPLDNISKIEIIENPQGVAYGGSAIMMVVNVISKISQQKMYKPSLRFQLYDPGSIYTNLNMGRRTTENFFRFTSSVDAFAGMPGNDSGRVLQWLPYTRLNNQLFYSHKVLQYMSLSVGYSNLYELKTQLGYPYPQTVRAYDREIKTINNTFYAGLNGNLTRYYSIQGDIQFMDHRRRNTLYLKDVSTAEQKAVNDTSLNDTIQYKMVYSRWVLTQRNKSKPINYQIGFDISTIRDTYKRLVNKVQQISTTTSLFGNIKYVPNPKLFLQAGFRLPYSANYKTKSSWDLRLNFKLTSAFRIKLFIARSTKTPNFDQMYATYLTNGYSIKRNLNLTEESIMSYHYALVYKINNTIIEPGFFTYIFKDGIELITESANSERLIHKNISEKRSIGTRVNIEQKNKYYNLNLRMILTGNNAFANLFDRQFFFQEVYSNITIKMDQIGLNLCLINKLTSLRGYMILDAVEGPQTYFINKYHLFDLVLEKSFSNKLFTLRTGIKNVFNVTNINSFSLPYELTSNVQPQNFSTSLLNGRFIFGELSLIF